jgi:hypothetical protein
MASPRPLGPLETSHSHALYEALSDSKEQGLLKSFLLEVESVRSQQVYTVPDR